MIGMGARSFARPGSKVVADMSLSGLYCTTKFPDSVFSIVTIHFA